MELRQYFSIVRKWLWLIILGGVLAGGSAFVFSILSLPVYQSTVTLLINQGAAASGVNYTDILTSQNIAATYVEQMKSPVLLSQAISDLNLPFTPTQLGGMMTVQQVRSTLLINIVIEDTNPERAQAIADKIANNFIATNSANQQLRYQAAQKDLNQQVADLRKKIDDDQKALVPLGNSTDPQNATAPAFVRTEQLRLQMELNTLQAQYTVLLQSAQDLRLAASRYADSITISTPAQLPQSPVRPNVRLNTLLGLVVGVMLAVGTAFLIEYLDDTAKSSEDVQRLLGLNTLGTVMLFPNIAQPRDGLVTVHSPRAPSAEVFRNLRTNVQFALLDHSSTALVVTSAEPGEGKTTTLANLGAVVAQMGKKVILVDTDLRRPTLHQYFDLKPEPGLTNVLLGEVKNLESVILETTVPGLRVMVSGTIPPNPAELLSSPRMDHLIDGLKKQADLVLFDSPPVLPVTDAALLAAKTGNLLWVVAAGKTRSDALRKAREALGQVEAKILGVVLNKMSAGRGGYGYYYYYAEGEHKQKRAKQLADAFSHPASSQAPARLPVPGNGSEPGVETAPESMKN